MRKNLFLRNRLVKQILCAEKMKKEKKKEWKYEIWMCENRTKIVCSAKELFEKNREKNITTNVIKEKYMR